MGLDSSFVAIQLVNGLQLAMLLFLLSMGLSVVFGLMDFLNMSHGTIYAFGAYLAYAITKATGSFWLALLCAPLIAALIGWVLYVAVLKRTQPMGHLVQVLVTLGILYIGLDGVRLLFGGAPLGVSEPAILSGAVNLLGQPYPLYRLFLIGLGAVIVVLLYFGLERTRFGAIVRAGVDDRVTVQTLGIDIERVFVLVFCLGAYLAGLAGVVAAPVFGVYPGMDVAILILVLIVVVVGGMGSLKGAIMGSLLIGMADTFGKILLPKFSSVAIYVLLAVILLLRPGGLIPARRYEQ
ncbi:MAG: branched-chain amino acid ABC transporter permease [Betaproteobacteria bacterium]|nr:branched-chain amino acid ABC transporter permease [Betaproteobacteria bacterium]